MARDVCIIHEPFVARLNCIANGRACKGLAALCLIGRVSVFRNSNGSMKGGCGVLGVLECDGNFRFSIEFVVLS